MTGSCLLLEIVCYWKLSVTRSCLLLEVVCYWKLSVLFTSTNNLHFTRRENMGLFLQSKLKAKDLAFLVGPIQ